MTERKWTKGPWFVADWKNDFGAELYTIEAREPEKLKPGQSSIWPDGIRCILIADCEGGDGDRLANARLIAAAPDLYEALESIFALINEENEINEIWFTETRRGKPLMEAARAVLRKARGEKSD